MVIHTVGSESCPYNLKGKETTGRDCPCFTMLETLAGVWETKLSFSLHLLSMAFGILGQMNKTKAMFKIILVYAHPFMPYFFIIKWAHVLMPLFYPTSTLCIIALFFFWIAVLLYWKQPFPFFLPSFLSCCSFFPSSHCFVSPSFTPYSVPPFPLYCTHLCDRLFLTHSTSAAPQMRAGRVGEQRGGRDAGP